MSRTAGIVFALYLLVVIVRSVPPDEKCAAVLCAAVEDCNDVYKPEGQCCESCRGNKLTCVYEGKTYQDNQRFWKDCNRCTCSDGEVSCTKIACVDDTCKNGNRQKLTKNPTDDPCTHCECVGDGTFICYSMLCAYIYCPNGYIKQKTECCKQCKPGPPQ